MSKAEELLDSLSIEDIQPFTSQPDIEGHIVIDKDRIIHVPTELKRIAVQYDANIETVTFDCPRYWDEHDLSEMNIYINYKLPSNLINNIGQSLVKNVRINEDDENIINFDWTIGPILTNNKGDLPFSVCAKSKTNQDSDEAIRWYTEINTELTISEGMDGSGDIEDNYEDLFPDIINDIISKLEGINATYDEKLEAFNTNATSKTESFDTNAETRTTEFDDNAAQKTLDYNNNCTSKIDSFNQNSTQKVTEFNDNYTSKLNSFNSNADSRIEELDTHADLALSSIPKNNAEGTDNTFADGLESPLYDLGGDGNSKQVVTTGANLLPYPYPSESKTHNGITFTVNKDGSVTVNGTSTDFCSFQILGSSNSDSQVNIPGNYISGGDNDISIAIYNNTGSGYVELGHSAGQFSEIDKSTYTQGYVELRIIEGKTFTNKIVYPMLSNEQNIPWEPYTGGQPSPSPDYPQPINSIEGSLEFVCRRKNLLNNAAISKTVNGLTFTVNKDKTITVNGTATRYTTLKISDPNNKLIPIIGNYISGGTSNVTLQIMNNETSSYIQLASSNSYKSTSINKTQFNRGYFELVVTEGTTVNNEVVKPMMTIEPITSEEYEPYIQPNEVTFNLNDEKLRSVGDVKDELVVDLDTGDYYKVENVGEVVFDGSDDEIIIKRSDITIPNTSCFRVENFDYTLIRDLIGMCNYFRYDTEKRNIKDTFRFIKSRGYAIQFCIEDNFASNSDEFRTWLSTHNTIVDYILQTPTTKKLGTLSAEDLAKLKTFKGYNNVTVNTNLGLMNIRFTYGLDIKKYIDNKLAEISAQLIRGE